MDQDIYRQSGIIPFRTSSNGLEILLITSLRKRHWIIPKGIVESDLSPAESAAKEGWEEAGVRGRLAAQPLGRYAYAKWGGICTVEVFLFEVTEVVEHWPERLQRQRRWFAHPEAVAAVNDERLRDLLASVPLELNPEEFA